MSLSRRFLEIMTSLDQLREIINLPNPPHSELMKIVRIIEEKAGKKEFKTYMKLLSPNDWNRFLTLLQEIAKGDSGAVQQKKDHGKQPQTRRSQAHTHRQ